MSGANFRQIIGCYHDRSKNEKLYVVRCFSKCLKVMKTHIRKRGRVFLNLKQLKPLAQPSKPGPGLSCQLYSVQME